MASRSRVFIALFLLFGSLTQGQNASQEVPSWEFEYQGEFGAEFESAYSVFPDLPRGLLEAISWTRTRMRNVQPDQEASSCMGLPSYWGPMGLMEDESGWFRNTLRASSEALGLQSDLTLRRDPAVNIMAAATQLQQSLDENMDLPSAILQCSELPSDASGYLSFPQATYLYSVLRLFELEDFREILQVKIPPFDLSHILGDNLDLLASPGIRLSGEEVSTLDGLFYNPVAASTLLLPCFDAPGVIWNTADPSNYSSRAGTSVSAVTIHTMQGYYAGSISWFQNPAANVSAHYLIRSSDGQVTQMVCESDKAWHVGTENPYTIGIEHEGFVSDPSWYTNAAYASSAALTRDITGDHGILPLRTYFKNAHSGVVTLGGCTRIKGHQHFPNQTHTDPGIHWDWERYYQLVNPTAATSVYTASSGSIYDPGGPTSSYGDDQRRFYRIEPTSGGTVALSFSAFDLELNWDYLYIHDGTSSSAPLIGVYTGTSSPGTIYGTSGALFLDFRSDCATVASGFNASWTTSGAPACGAPDGTYTGPIGWTSATVNWNPVAGSSGYQIAGRKAGTSSWRTLNTNLTAKWIGILSEGTSYQWRVRAYCGSDWSDWSVINSFSTNTIRDSGFWEVRLLPNPATDLLQIQVSQPQRVELFNSLGQRVLSRFTEGQLSLDVSELPRGSYVLATEGGKRFQVVLI